ncbi:MAG TPA: cytidyltransferase [Sutterella sp.]|nr:cytidyltransferase [Sutterella sp.]
MVTNETKRPRVMVDMSATLIHHGHVRLLKKAAEIGEVVVALTSDEEVKKTKGYVPELNFEERKEILLAIRYVSEVVACPWLITEAFMDEHHCDLLVHGADNSNRISPERLVIFPRTKGVSSSLLRQRVLDALIEMNIGKQDKTTGDILTEELLETVKNRFRME